MRTQIAINKIEKESEKAILVNFTVSWGEGGMKLKSIWVPKSACTVLREDLIECEDWFLRKIGEQNTWKGYRMYIENQFPQNN